MRLRQIINRVTVLGLLAVLITAPLSGAAGAAGSAYMYFQHQSPLAVGSTFDLSVRVNTNGSRVNAAEADFTYPQAILTANSVSPAPTAPTADNPFNVDASTTFGSGSVSIQRGSTLSGGAEGDVLVATVSFTVVGQGVADFTFQNSSSALDITTNANDLSSLVNDQFIGIPNLAPVYRLSAPKKYLFTLSGAELASASRFGFVYEGVGFYASPNTNTGLSPVYRLRNPTTGSYFFTSSASERTSAINTYKFIDEGVGFYESAVAAGGFTSVYRLNRNGTYLFTTSTTERDAAINNYGFRDEGVGFYATTSTTSNQAVYRLRASTKYLFTLSPGEVMVAAKLGYNYEGLAFFASPVTGTGLSPVYRLRSPRGGYLLTTSSSERDTAVSNYGFIYEGIVFYGSSVSASGFTPAYRLSRSGGYLFTTSPAERDIAISTYGFISEGTGFYGATN